jgi:hypothetical protein
LRFGRSSKAVTLIAKGQPARSSDQALADRAEDEQGEMLYQIVSAASPVPLFHWSVRIMRLERAKALGKAGRDLAKNGRAHPEQYPEFGD